MKIEYTDQLCVFFLTTTFEYESGELVTALTHYLSECKSSQCTNKFDLLVFFDKLPKSSLVKLKKFNKHQNINKIIESPVNIDPIKSSDKELLDHFKSKSTTIYHPCGTCRMSKSIQQGVVSEKLKVHGIDNLWVVDASVMPNITSGNINAPVMMLSHLSSKIILEELKQQYQ